MSFQYDTRRTSWVLFALYVMVCCLVMLETVVKAGSCSCPSCNQRDAVQRCACCVYRQYGKRASQEDNTYSGLDAAFEKKPVIAEGADWSDLDDDSDNNENELSRINPANHSPDDRLRSRFSSNQTPNSYIGDFFPKGPLNHRVSQTLSLGTELTSYLMDVLQDTDPKTRGFLKLFLKAQPSPFFNSYRFVPEVRAWKVANSRDLVPLK